MISGLADGARNTLLRGAPNAFGEAISFIKPQSAQRRHRVHRGIAIIQNFETLSRF